MCFVRNISHKLTGSYPTFHLLREYFHCLAYGERVPKDTRAKCAENSVRAIFILEEVGPAPAAEPAAGIPSFPVFDPFHPINKWPENHRTSCKFHSVLQPSPHDGLLRLRPIVHLSWEPQRAMSFPLGQILVHRDG